eukprot:TRINITY_DN15601_c0_g1_i3.p4 TRINITY_DN15601_c0_g1~~TRINITY_DN15601_c0_g1_i3.p4  ORF type:complete len:150 (+),score=47.13 TRINITY_DN15601_c0_g1_i3:1456-1905(+)
MLKPESGFELSNGPMKPRMEEPAQKDPFADMYSLANSSLTSKAHPKPTPFDDDPFGQGGYKPTAASSAADDLFGGAKSQKAAEELFGGPDTSSTNDFFGGSSSKAAADDFFGGMPASNSFNKPPAMHQPNDMFGGMSQPKGPGNDFDFF